MCAGEHYKIWRNSAVFADSGERMAGFVLHEAKRGDIFSQLDYKFHAHVAKGLHEERQGAFFCDGAIVAGYMVKMAGISRRQRDDRVGAELPRLARIAGGGFRVGTLDA